MAKALSLNDIRSRAASFARQWRDVEGYERGEAQSFVRDLLGVYGITETRAGLYEHRVQRSSNAQRGYIDALVPGLAVIEMKSAGKDLSEAERQALDYLDSLTDAEMPRYVLTSDFRRFRLLDLHGIPGGGAAPGWAVDVAHPRAGLVVEFSLDDLPREAERLAFFAGYGTRSFGDAEQERASIKAAQLMAGLYEELEDAGTDDHAASVFLVRTLFCLYADDAGVWERDLFYEFLETRTSVDGADLGTQMAKLFQVMATAADRRSKMLDELVARFPYVNGGVFDHVVVMPDFTRLMRERLLAACAFNWSAISPAVFGSMFQAVKSKEARRSLGEHYTTETNILKLINPLFMDELLERFALASSDVAALRRLRADMGKMRFLDPACGCGNFLVIAYRELRALDLEVLVRIQDLAAKGHDRRKTKEVSTLFFSEDDLLVTLDHFHGIEIEEWPAQIAATALHLAEHQANQAMALALGRAPDTLPLDKVQTITVGNALQLDWAEAVDPCQDLYIMGNPPYAGHETRTPEQSQELRRVWHREDIGRLDYVTAWYKKAIDLYDATEQAGQFAFVSTNSVTQGEPVAPLFGPIFDAGWRIKFAHRTFTWTSEAPGAAAVHCVIVGFDQRPRSPAWLFTYGDGRGEPERHPVTTQINAYLIDGPNVLVEQGRSRLSPALPPLVMGSMPRDDGGLVVEADAKATVEQDPVAAKYLRKYVGGRELIHDLDRWCLWLVDLDPRDVARSPVLTARLAHVKAFRERSRAASTRQMAATPHLFGQRAQPTTAFTCMPKVASETRLFFLAERFGQEVVPSDLTFTAADADGLVFAVVSSSMLVAWLKAVGGRLKSDLRFSNTLVWNTFPLPAIDQPTRAKLIEAGQGVLAARALHPAWSLADHYNPLAMTPQLLKAHAALDRVMDKAMGAKRPLRSNDERLSLLFANYEKMTHELRLEPRGRSIAAR